MGGGSKKQTVGYKYYLGMHMILCHGPIDRFSAIKVDNRSAWAGSLASGSVYVNAENLFGGESREGGVSGQVDFEGGGPTQGVNPYLASRCGPLVPAYRGVAGVVLRQCYLGINPYLKRWGFRGTRIQVRQDGIEQWYPERASIGSAWTTPQAIYIALDISGSMDTVTSNGQTRLQNAKTAIVGLLDYIKDLSAQSNQPVHLIGVAWGGSSQTQQYLNATSANIESLKTWFNGRTTIGSTDFRVAVANVSSFFGATGSAQRTVLFITDGEPDVGGSPDATTIATEAAATLFATPNIKSFAFNIDLSNITYTSYMDNTPEDGVPVVSGANPDSLLGSLAASLGGVVDMNPAHIIRECLTDPDWGMGYLEAEIDNSAFTGAADALWAEGMGMSLLWDRQVPIEDFIKEVVKHIDATLYVDRRTGLFKLKLIRNDYDLGSLIHLNVDNIDKVTDFSRPAFAELTNSVTVNYWDSPTGTTASKTIQDIALAQMQGATINTTLQYPGFTNGNLAARAAQRDMMTLSTPLASCTIYTNRDADDLNIGDTFLFTWPDYEVYDLPMRVTGAAYGNGKSNRIRLTATQDRFGTPTEALIPEIPPEWENPDQPPTPLERQVAFEVPYFELIQQQTQSVVDQAIASNPDLGYVGAAASRTDNATLNALFNSNAGAGYEEVGIVDFGASALLGEDLDPMITTFAITEEADTDTVEINSWLILGTEIMSVVSLAPGSLTVKRGVLDTVPVAHAEGEVIHFADAFTEIDPTEYVDSDTVNVKLLPVTGQGSLPIDSATAMPVNVAARAVRPYPPGNFKVNDEYFPTALEGNLELTWASRNRLQQTGGTMVGFPDGDVTPEAGTTYTVRATNVVSSVVLVEHTGLTTTSDTILVGSLSGVTRLRLELFSVRDGYESYQYQTAEFDYSSGENTLQFTEPYTPPAYNAVDLQFEEPTP
ncbi:tail protein [Stenotrophomonas phage vB_SmaS_Bhz59]